MALKKGYCRIAHKWTCVNSDMCRTTQWNKNQVLVQRGWHPRENAWLCYGTNLESAFLSKEGIGAGWTAEICFLTTSRAALYTTFSLLLLPLYISVHLSAYHCFQERTVFHCVYTGSVWQSHLFTCYQMILNEKTEETHNYITAWISRAMSHKSAQDFCLSCLWCKTN